MATALVVGGTGPTGPFIVNGLLKRGYEVTVLHGGFHEAEFDEPVEHIHTDPHFKETLEEGVGNRGWWDLIVFTEDTGVCASGLNSPRDARAGSSSA